MKERGVTEVFGSFAITSVACIEILCREPKVYGSIESFVGYFRNRRKEFNAASLKFTEVSRVLATTSVTAEGNSMPRACCLRK